MFARRSRRSPEFADLIARSFSAITFRNSSAYTASPTSVTLISGMAWLRSLPSQQWVNKNPLGGAS